MTQPLIAVGLNPAWQKTLAFRKFIPGGVNRAHSMTERPSGKRINFCRARTEWKSADNTNLFQFAGGVSGKMLKDGIDAEGIIHHTVEVSGRTRTCTTVINEADSSMTELIEPSSEISADEEKKLTDSIISSLSGAAGLALCGTYPPGIRKREFTWKICEVAAALAVPVFADLWQNADEIMNPAISILKINREELSSLSGKNDMKQGIKELFKRFPHLKYLGISDGPSTAVLAEHAQTSYFMIPELEKIVNPLGAGDTASAVFFAELTAGKNPVEAFADGLAAASASCLHLIPAKFNKKDALAIRKQIKIGTE